ncbi:MAG: uroporphyrinogen-III C-methyltransferase [Pseudomonadota bacterium]
MSDDQQRDDAASPSGEAQASADASGAKADAKTDSKSSAKTGEVQDRVENRDSRSDRKEGDGEGSDGQGSNIQVSDGKERAQSTSKEKQASAKQRSAKQPPAKKAPVKTQPSNYSAAEELDRSVAEAAPQPSPVAVQAPRSSAGPIAWLALLLVLVLAGGGFYLMLDVQRREGDLLQRVQGLESVSGQDDTTFNQMRDNLQRQIELEIEGIRSRQQRAEEDQQRAIGRLEQLIDASATTVLQDTGSQLRALQQAQQDQQQRLNELSTDDRESWLLAEAQYLLRLANQRLIMTGDTESAEALLRSADNILRELDDADLHGLRSALASDLAAVRAVPKLDMQGLYLRLDALIRQTDALVLFELPERPSERTTVDADNWRDRVVQGYELALQKLSEYIVVSRRDAPVETLMDPQYEGLVRQNMRMLLEQAQVAMISGNELLYRQSLERAQGWVSQFFKADEQSAVAMSEELTQLREQRVEVLLPDVSASMRALDEVMKARLARSGE